jgi:predicted outer membrane protein
MRNHRQGGAGLTAITVQNRSEAGQTKAKEDGGMSKQHWVRGAWAVAAIMATGVAWAALPQQTSNDPATGQAPGTTRRSADWEQIRGGAMNGRVDVDHFLAKVIRQANRDEIATAQLAGQRASNPDVKKFAMQMVDDHTRFMNRLQQFEGQHKTMPGAKARGFNQGASNFQSAPATTQSSATSDTANDHNATGLFQPNPPRSSNQPAAPAPGFAGQVAGQDMHARHNAAHQFIGIMDQVAEKTERSIQRELSQKEGAQFDRCFLSWQVMDHMWLVEALTVFEQNASPGLQPILQEGLQTAQQHLTHAKALLSQLEQQHVKSTAQRDRGLIQDR